MISVLSINMVTYLSLFGHNLDEVVCAHVIHVWNKDGEEVRVVISRIYVFLHTIVPVLPFAYDFKYTRIKRSV